MIERRGFLRGGIASLVLAGAGPLLLTSGPSRAADGELSLEDFGEQLDTWFEFRGETTHHALLVEAHDHPVDRRLEQFWLVFRGPDNDAIAEGTYDVVSARGDQVQLFVQPAGSDASGTYYRSQICRMRPLSAGSCAGNAG